MRQVALKHALTAKAKSSDLIVIDEAKLGEPKTKQLAQRFGKLGLKSALIVDGAEIEKNFRLAARNLGEIDVLPVQGINVYDILRRTKLVLTKNALEALEARLK
jgi:large subunit ribosomal protein L4